MVDSFPARELVFSLRGPRASSTFVPSSYLVQRRDFIRRNSGTLAVHGNKITARARRRRHRPSPFLFLSLSFRLNKWTDVFGTVHSRRRAREPSSTHTRSTACRCYTSAGLCGQKRWPFALGVASCEPSIGETRRGEDKPKRCRPDHCTSQGEERPVPSDSFDDSNSCVISGHNPIS